MDNTATPYRAYICHKHALKLKTSSPKEPISLDLSDDTLRCVTCDRDAPFYIKTVKPLQSIRY